MTSKAGRRAAFIKIANPEEGISKAEYLALCERLGIEPVFENAASDPADPVQAEPDSQLPMGTSLPLEELNHLYETLSSEKLEELLQSPPLAEGLVKSPGGLSS